MNDTARYPGRKLPGITRRAYPKAKTLPGWRRMPSLSQTQTAVNVLFGGICSVSLAAPTREYDTENTTIGWLAP